MKWYWPVDRPSDALLALALWLMVGIGLFSLAVAIVLTIVDAA